MRRSEIFHYQEVALLSGFLTIGQGERDSLPRCGRKQNKREYLGQEQETQFWLNTVMKLISNITTF